MKFTLFTHIKKIWKPYYCNLWILFYQNSSAWLGSRVHKKERLEEVVVTTRDWSRNLPSIRWMLYHWATNFVSIEHRNSNNETFFSPEHKFGPLSFELWILSILSGEKKRISIFLCKYKGWVSSQTSKKDLWNEKETNSKFQ